MCNGALVLFKSKRLQLYHNNDSNSITVCGWRTQQRILSGTDSILRQSIIQLVHVEIYRGESWQEMDQEGISDLKIWIEKCVDRLIGWRNLALYNGDIASLK